jgi:hypothetical protein
MSSEIRNVKLFMGIICKFVCNTTIILHCFMKRYRNIETYKFDKGIQFKNQA